MKTAVLAYSFTIGWLTLWVVICISWYALRLAGVA